MCRKCPGHAFQFRTFWSWGTSTMPLKFFLFATVFHGTFLLCRSCRFPQQFPSNYALPHPFLARSAAPLTCCGNPYLLCLWFSTGSRSKIVSRSCLNSCATSVLSRHLRASLCIATETIVSTSLFQYHCLHASRNCKPTLNMVWKTFLTIACLLK